MINEEKVYSVYEFNSLVDNTMRSSLPFIAVEGEVAKITVQQTSGHWYFSIKDDKASLDCVMFRSSAASQSFVPKCSDKIIVYGTPNVYPQSGRFQLKCSLVKRSGQGTLLEIIEENKRKWQNTYFARPHRQLPVFVRDVVIITSLTGEVLHDILTNIGNGLNITVVPAMMQGEMCAESVSNAIYGVNKAVKEGKLKADVLLVARGGGSFEDLYPFNDERIVKALSLSEIVCISAIGHDPDNPLCDYSADIRANAPTQAGAFIRQNRENFIKFILDSKALFSERITRRVENAYQKNDFDKQKLSSLLISRASGEQMRLNHKKEIIFTYLVNLFKHKKQIGESKVNLLNAYSPFGILDRGYSIVKTTDGKVVKNVSSLEKGVKFVLKMSDGEINALSEGKI